MGAHLLLVVPRLELFEGDFVVAVRIHLVHRVLQLVAGHADAELPQQPRHLFAVDDARAVVVDVVKQLARLRDGGQCQTGATPAI